VIFDMIISVIGANGFIGLKLVKELVDSGIRVRVLSRKNIYPIKGVEVFVADLTDTNFNIEGFLDNTDILYNCSGEVNDESLMQKLHVTAVQRLIKLSKGKVGRWVQLGSVGSYGNCRNGVITENSDDKPVGVYETTKTESDNLIKERVRHLIT
jgi:nucleoside-diphosphate-sugar epimerase